MGVSTCLHVYVLLTVCMSTCLSICLPRQVDRHAGRRVYCLSVKQFFSPTHFQNLAKCVGEGVRENPEFVGVPEKQCGVGPHKNCFFNITCGVVEKTPKICV